LKIGWFDGVHKAF